jgi:hypothetical protein
MHIYLQIPHTSLQSNSDKKRAKQAKKLRSKKFLAYKLLGNNPETAKFTPRLLAYEETSQGDEWPVTGGLPTYIVWQIVPGVRLGGSCDFGKATQFWALYKTQAEREEIRHAVRVTIL